MQYVQDIEMHAQLECTAKTDLIKIDKKKLWRQGKNIGSHGERKFRGKKLQENKQSFDSTYFSFVFLVFHIVLSLL